MGIETLYGSFLHRDVTDEDLGEAKLDKELTKKFSTKHRGSVRVTTGRFLTRTEWEERRKKLLKRQLPGK